VTYGEDTVCACVVYVCVCGGCVWCMCVWVCVCVWCMCVCGVCVSVCVCVVYVCVVCVCECVCVCGALSEIVQFLIRVPRGIRTPNLGRSAILSGPLPLRRRTTSLNVVSSIPDGAIDIILPVALWPRSQINL
jgi:hypothetical protein